MTKEDFVDVLRAVCEGKRHESTEVNLFPEGYQETYDLGIHHGRTQTAQFILNMMDKYIK